MFSRELVNIVDVDAAAKLANKLRSSCLDNPTCRQSKAAARAVLVMLHCLWMQSTTGWENLACTQMQALSFASPPMRDKHLSLLYKHTSVSESL
jgi:hypothetical protein